MKKVLALLLAAMMLVICVPALSAEAEEPVRDNGVGYDLSAVHAAYLLSNGQLSTTDYFTIDDISSHTITVLNFWSQNCSYCLPEMPYFQYIHDNYPNVLMVGCGSSLISGTQSGEASYFANHGYTYMSVFQDTVLYNYHRPNGYLPQTVILNNQGIVVEIFEGAISSQATLVSRVEYWLNYYTPAAYNVTFVDGLTNGIIEVQSVAAGGKPTYPTPPVHEGYTFTGWDPATPPLINAPTTITANYSANSYNLTILYLDADGNTFAAPVVLSYSYGTSYSIASPIIPGFTPDIPVVSGIMTGDITVVVTYTQDAPPAVILAGDVDCNGVVDFDDVTLLNAYLLNAASLTAQGAANANINGDNRVSSADVVALNIMILGSN